ncbi:site-specific integrase [Litorilituus lipolyticus]|uniref:Site-specific integrase n=1 Tax=Litorilituus lipolyticus TaxID=2491017 RepID=A0A502KTD0_9GAMM|nr:site-specific integrase [Litorilituus lipolyticus]TPH13271.1 site-specific integrase [Litorilituus lipolyticus]
MATFTKRENGKWQAKIRRKGQKSISKTFLLKSSAQQWAREIELNIDKGSFESTESAENAIFPDLLHKYWEEVVQYQKSANVTIYILNKWIILFNGKRMIDMTTSRFKEYKEQRLKKVKGDTIRKELLLLKRFFDYSMNEWQIHLPKGNPLNPISLPKKSKSRERRLEEGEYNILMDEAKKYGGLIADIIDFAIETGMRCGEIVKLSRKELIVKKRIIKIPDTKNGDDRVVPLSSKALSILMRQSKDNDNFFNMRVDSVSQAFRRVRKRAGLINIRMHDMRHEATSRLFEKDLQLMEVSAITGHKDLAMLKKYTHLRAEDLALKLG